ncbi:unnamed protein product [Closterium sp. NIES-53]
MLVLVLSCCLVCAAAVVCAAAAAARLLLPPEVLLPPALLLLPTLLLPPVLLLLRCCCYSAAAATCAAAVARLLLPPALLLPPVLLLLHCVTRDDVSLFKHTLGSLQAPKAPAEPTADAGKEVRTPPPHLQSAFTSRSTREPTFARCLLGCLALPLNFPALSELITVANEGGRSGAGGSGGGGHQELEPSCVAACVPTSTVYAHPSTVLSCLVVTSASSGSTEGGDPTAADTTTSRRSSRLETPPGFPPRTSSPPLQPVVADFGDPGVVGGGDAGGASSGGAASGGARSPLVGGVGGTGAGGAGLGPTPTCTTPPLLFPPPDSPLPAPARYVPLSVSLTGRREPVSCAASLAPSRVTQEPVVLPLPPPSSLPATPASSPAAACALVAELAGFAATCHRAYLAGLISASSCPLSVGGELALGCDVLEDRQFELEYLPYPLSIRTRYVAPGRHHPAHWRAARRVLHYLVRLASKT